MKCPKCGYETIHFGEVLDPCIACGFMGDVKFYSEATSESHYMNKFEEEAIEGGNKWENY